MLDVDNFMADVDMLLKDKGILAIIYNEFFHLLTLRRKTFIPGIM